MHAMLKAAVCSLLAGLLALAPPAGAAEVKNVRLGHHSDYTRVVLDLSEPVEFEIFTLADPYRVVVDLPEMTWAADSSSFKVRAGVVSGLRFGLFQPGNSRLVLDADGPVDVRQAFILPPGHGRGHRFVIDLAQTDRASFVAALRPPAPSEANLRRNGTPVPMSKPGRAEGAPRIIVLDPGHGGVDPGTVARGGRFEKHVVLEYAQEIARRLEAKGKYKVLMTRDRDVFLPLRERVRIAHEAAADLFISIHADSIANRNIRGGAIYTLSETGSDAEADALAAKENKSDVIAGVALDNHDEEVVSILIDLAQRETMNYGIRFAGVLVGELNDNNVPLRTKPHRYAAFRVLKAPDVPSVLLELGYLTNREDEKFLLSPRARGAVARAIAAAVDKYFAEFES